MSHRSRGPVFYNLQKTELCRNFKAENCCQYGDKCRFAHGKSELRKPTPYGERAVSVVSQGTQTVVTFSALNAPAWEAQPGALKEASVPNAPVSVSAVADTSSPALVNTLGALRFDDLPCFPVALPYCALVNGSKQFPPPYLPNMH